MSALNIEVLEKKILRLSVKETGELELIVSHPSGRLGEKDKYEFIDQVIAIIPQNRREVLANFILTAP